MGRYARFRALMLHPAPTYPEEHYPQEPIISAAPNLGHDTDSHHSGWAYLVDLWTRALAVALGGRLMRSDILVTAGHRHDDYRTEVEWMEILRVRPLGDNQGTSGPGESKDLLYINSTLVKNCFWLMVHIPSWYEELELYVRVAQPAPGAPTPDGTLEVTAQLYDLIDSGPTLIVETVGPMSLESKIGGIQFPNKWIGPLRINVESWVPLRGVKWLGVQIQARAYPAGAIGGIWEAKLGKNRR